MYSLFEFFVPYKLLQTPCCDITFRLYKIKDYQQSQWESLHHSLKRKIAHICF